MARGKALVAKLRKDPKVVDAEALAAWIGRRKKLLKSGVSAKKAGKLAGKEGGMKQGGVKGAGGGKKDSGRPGRGADIVDTKVEREKFNRLPEKDSYEKGEEVVGFPRLRSPWGGEGKPSPDMRKGKVLAVRSDGKVLVSFEKAGAPQLMDPKDLRTSDGDGKRGGSSSKAERKAPTSKASDSELIRRWGTADRAEIRRKQDEIMARQRAGLNLARKGEKTGPGRGRPEKSNGPAPSGPGKLKDGRTSTYEGKKFTEVKDSSGEARGTIMQEKDGSFKVYLKNPEQYEGLQGGTNGPYPANRERLIFRGDTKAEVKKKFTEFLAKADKRRKKK